MWHPGSPLAETSSRNDLAVRFRANYYKGIGEHFLTATSASRAEEISAFLVERELVYAFPGKYSWLDETVQLLLHGG